MNQNRTGKDDVPTRSMDPAEGSRDTARDNASDDLGTSTDRAMSDDRMSKSGGITNRSLDEEQREQEQLPDRGRSQSER